jgi:hypothetical protein
MAVRRVLLFGDGVCLEAALFIGRAGNAEHFGEHRVSLILVDRENTVITYSPLPVPYLYGNNTVLPSRAPSGLRDMEDLHIEHQLVMRL